MAIDRPLGVNERKRLRAITSRATITSTRLVNTYEWGDFKGDPHELVAKHFDAFRYYANWGARRLTLRVPSARLDLRIAKQYCRLRTDAKRGNRSVATVALRGKNLVFDFWSENETADDWDDTEALRDFKSTRPPTVHHLSRVHHAPRTTGPVSPSQPF